MSNAKYTMITIAGCKQSYVKEALGHVGGFVGDLIAQAGCVGARYGVISTGDHAGSLLLLQSYASLGDIEKAFAVYGGSSDYTTLMGSGNLSVTLRNIIRLEDVNVPTPSAETPAYGVLSLMSGPLNLDKVPDMMPAWVDGGAMVIRYGTLITGSNAGKRVLAVGYPSMDAIQKTYEGLMGNAAFQAVQASIDLERRDIVRIAG